jgi:Zn-dependent peptidase ImmA (M78 family)
MNYWNDKMNSNGGSLDAQLRSLTDPSWSRLDSPLSVRRFVDEFGKESPGAAMKFAADLLLAAYGHDRHGLPIEVEKLCQLCGAELKGVKPKARTSSAYSMKNDRPRSGHTGKLYLDRTKASIKIPHDVDHSMARLSVAHELGHLLIHRRGSEYDEATMRLGSSPEEEALAEYCARLLLMPTGHWLPQAIGSNLAEYAIERASQMRVTLHSAVTRFGDPDVTPVKVRGAILWRMNPVISALEPMGARLTPQWHLCPGAFVPVRKSKARAGSVVAELADAGRPAGESRLEQVEIGSFIGYFRVDAFAWGSVQEGTRVVLSLFVEP